MTWSLPRSDTYFKTFLEKEPRGFQITHLDYALSFCKKFRTAIDGGAHIGTWSVELSKKFAKVVSFEPAEDTYRCLRENTEAISNIHPLFAALGHVTTRGKMMNDETRPGNTGSRFLQINSDGDTQVERLDSFALDDVDFLKLDVEGHELEALLGAEWTIKKAWPVIMIECKKLRSNHDPMAAQRWLRTIGYREMGRIGRDHVFIKGYHE